MQFGSGYNLLLSNLNITGSYRIKLVGLTNISLLINHFLFTLTIHYTCSVIITEIIFKNKIVPLYFVFRDH